MADSEGLSPCWVTQKLRLDNRHLQLMRRTETPHHLCLPNVQTQQLDPAHYRHGVVARNFLLVWEALEGAVEGIGEGRKGGVRRAGVIMLLTGTAK